MHRLDATMAPPLDEYRKWATKQQQIQDVLKAAIDRFNIMSGDEKTAELEAMIESAEEEWTEYGENHNLLGALLESNPSLSIQTYYSQDRYTAGQTVYNELIAKLYSFARKFDTARRESMQIDKNPDPNVSITELINTAVEKALAERGDTATPRGEVGQDGFAKLCETISNGQNRQELKFPTFPSDISLFFDWKQRVENWFESDGRNLKNIVRLQKIKDACEKSAEASMITRKYQLLERNYEPCMAELNRRFNMARNVAFAEVARIISLVDAANTKFPRLQHVYDVITAARANIEAVATADAMSSPLPAGKTLQYQIMESKFNLIFTALIYRTLDPATKTSIASKLDLPLSRIPPANDVLAKIERRFIDRQEAEVNESDAGPSRKKHAYPHDFGEKGANDLSRTELDSCLLCDGRSHETRTCPRLFNLASTREKWELVKKRRVCANCLTGRFGSCDCHTPGCSICGKRHADVLHYKAEEQHGISCMAAKGGVALRPTANIKVTGPNGTFGFTALFDTGATDTVVSERLLEVTGMPTTPVNVNMEVPGGYKKIIKMTMLHAQGHVLPALVMESLGAPTSQLTDSYDGEHTRLADPEYFLSKDVDVIFGITDIAELLAGPATVKDKLIRQPTVFGLVLSGVLPARREAPTYVEHVGRRSPPKAELWRSHGRGDDREVRVNTKSPVPWRANANPELHPSVVPPAARSNATPLEDNPEGRGATARYVAPSGPVSLYKSWRSPAVIGAYGTAAKYLM